MSTGYQYVYVVRHGLTEGNIARTVQGMDDPLAEEGHAQAARLAERARRFRFEHLLASDMLRAQQTAQYISDATGKDVVSEPLLREARCSDAMVGLDWTHESVLAYRQQYDENIHDENWQYEESETFYHTRARSLKALSRFEEFGGDPILAVSHSFFIRTLVATVLTERELSPTIWLHFGRTIRIHNTGISIFRRCIETNHWELYCLNDHAHFADN